MADILNSASITMNLTGKEKTSQWPFRQAWDENGASFTIKFDHNGEVETLTLTHASRSPKRATAA